MNFFHRKIVTILKIPRFYLSVFGLGLTLSFSIGCEISYILKQGYYQLDLLTGRTSIYKAINNPELSVKEKNNLKRVISVKEFCEDVLGLDKNNNYTTVNLKWKREIYNVQACERLRFRSYKWRFPIVGEVPYKGFFNKEDAENEAQILSSLGYDVLVSKVRGYSTLGYFNDPLTRDMINLEEHKLIELIIHELVHSTLYIKGETEFNESLANFVAKEGTIIYIESFKGRGSNLWERVNLEIEDDIKFREIMIELFRELDGLYNSKVSDEIKLTKKSEIIGRYIEKLKATPFNVKMYWTIPVERFNNAFILSHKFYNYKFSYFETLLNRSNHDFKRFFKELKKALHSGKGTPFEKLERFLKESSNKHSAL